MHSPGSTAALLVDGKEEVYRGYSDEIKFHSDTSE
jgi:hypothetical protein